ncbi:MAG: RHS repeat-associated core domain-containing protein [Fimbriimonadaceae bacterium]
MTASPSLNGSGGTSWSYLNDELGNRTSRNLQANNYNVTAMRYDWDVLNRAKNIMQQDKGASYYYRADGMRVEKVEGATILWTPNGSRGSGTWDANYAQNRPTTRYFYDGQMPMEEDYNPATGGGVSKVTRNLLGARGIDMISTTTSGGTAVAYPIYDGHGNCIATLAKNGTGYTTGNWRSYDVWGSVRSGNATGDPTKRYCANLGHQADDESDLLYMRARYYEPASGRFVSEDPLSDGQHWFIYCDNDPLNRVDFTGKKSSVFWTTSLFALATKLITEFGKDFSDGGWSVKRVLMKTSGGLVQAYVSTWGIKAAWACVKASIDIIKANGWAALFLSVIAIYTCVLILMLDALLIGGIEALVDHLAPDPKSGGMNW